MSSHLTAFAIGSVSVREAARACRLTVFAKHVVHPERSGKNGVATQPFKPEEAPDEAPS
jgi:hypothetical protein